MIGFDGEIERRNMARFKVRMTFETVVADFTEQAAFTAAWNKFIRQRSLLPSLNEAILFEVIEKEDLPDDYELAWFEAIQQRRDKDYEDQYYFDDYDFDCQPDHDDDRVDPNGEGMDPAPASDHDGPEKEQPFMTLPAQSSSRQWDISRGFGSPFDDPGRRHITDPNPLGVIDMKEFAANARVYERALSDGVLIPKFMSLWSRISNSKPIYVTALVRDELSDPLIILVWNEYVRWCQHVQKHLPNAAQQFETRRNGLRVWVMEDALAFTILCPEELGPERKDVPF